MTKQELIIIRHARSQHNIGQSNDLDCGITEFGERQATNVGKFLQHQFFEGKFNLNEWMIYTSPFLRCLQTTKLMTEHMDNPTVEVHNLLREYLNHSGDQVHIPNRKNDFPSFNWKYIPDDGTEFKKEHNETFLERIHNIHDTLKTKSIVVTHGLPAYTLKHVAAHNANYVPVWDNSIDNCSITWIRNSRVVWQGRNLYNEISYKPENYNRCFILEP